jgi:RND family efflux transporter MFP subunit
MTRLFRIIMPLLILFLAGILTMAMIQKRPIPERVDKEEPAMLVQVLKVHPEDTRARIMTTGTVRAVREARVSAQVSGRVEFVSSNLIQGGVLNKDELILRIDDRDYLLAIERTRAQVASAELELARVEGSAMVARQEWELFKDQDHAEPNPLVLYEPQLRNARAALDAAMAALAQAELDLERTAIKAPFASRVLSQSVAPGQYISQAGPVAVLAEVEKAEVVIHLPLSELKWVEVPLAGAETGGSEAKVRIMGEPEDRFRPTKIARSLGQVDPGTRMMGVIVEVEDPYALKAQNQGHMNELPLGSFVQVEIMGRELENIFVLPRRALQEHSFVWIADQENRLQSREVTVERFEMDQVMISSGIEPGVRIVLTNITAPARGMQLRIENTHE